MNTTTEKIQNNITHLCEVSKKSVEQILQEIENLGEQTDNEKLKEYLWYSDDRGYYLYNIGDIDNLSYLDLSVTDEIIIDKVQDKVLYSNELELIETIFETLYAYYDVIEEDSNMFPLISNVLTDLENNLLFVLEDIDNIIPYLEEK